MCFNVFPETLGPGFDSSLGPISITVTRSDGSTTSGSVTPDIGGVLRWDFTPLPGDPLGDYTLIAEQQSSTSSVPEAQLDYSVVEATSPRFHAIDVSGSPGSVFRVAVAGLPASAAFFLYGPESGSGSQRDFPLRRSLPMPDFQSEGIYSVQTTSDDPPGLYALWTDGCDRLACATFTLAQ